MYKIHLDKNQAERIEPAKFGELKLRERQHLQEWIAKNPEMLGPEELLIIQKEYSGFEETNERLDLLALDKQGRLVVIENKLDDSGKDVVWQALKYTSYCSTLTTEQIISIFQDYLNATGQAGEARQLILDFIDKPAGELLLNQSDQRIFLVAREFRKEVTSTVLWLLNHNVQIQCFKVTPYQVSQDLFIQMEQIIPLPETSEYMIRMLEKEQDDHKKTKASQQTEEQLIKFWTQLKAALKAQQFLHLENIAIRPQYSMGFWKGQGLFAFAMGRKAYRIELYIENDPEKILFNQLRQHEAAINAQIGKAVHWDPLENRKASRIKIELDPLNGEMGEIQFSNETDWQKIIEWYFKNMKLFFETISPYWEKIKENQKYKIPSETV